LRDQPGIRQARQSIAIVRATMQAAALRWIPSAQVIALACPLREVFVASFYDVRTVVL
jgi:hypothetical protein